MSTIDELRATLESHAAALPDHDAHARSGSVHQRVRAVRRRRLAGASLAAAGVATAVVLAVASGPHGGGAAPQPAGPGPSHPTPSADAAPAPSYPPQLVPGGRLVGSFVGEAGQAVLRFEVPAKGPTKLWSIYCAPAGSGWFKVSFNGDERMFGQCGTASGTPSSGWSSFDDLVTRSGAPLGPDDTIEVEIKLYERKGSHVLASDPDIRLGTGVYEK